ncbi:MAG TPA: SpoIIE family protein phosphatase [Chlamydiales bacterium]|nr:SpoIIE family protein phosphatase [Chlamydiales bacterium]
MAEEKIRIKPPHAIASLAGRAVIVSLCLLVFPLFLHSFFLYKKEYASALADAKETLIFVSNAHRAILEEKMQGQWQLLDAIGNIDSKELHITQVIIAVPTPIGLPPHFAMVNGNVFYVGKKISEERSLAIANPANLLFQELQRQVVYGYPLFLSIESQGNIVMGPMPQEPLSVRVPIENSDVSLILSIPVDAVAKLHKTWYLYHFLSLLFFVGCIGGLFVWLITKRIAKPLRRLCEVMKRVGEGAQHARYQPDRMGFEINEIGKQFNQTLDLLLKRTAEAERERIARERLAEEWKIGRDIQGNLFPSSFPEFKGLDIASEFLPAQEVSGDFYDLFPLEDGKLMIAIADTAGKGISACLFSLGLRSALRALAAEGMLLSEIVLRANDLLWKDVRHNGMFITLWLGIYDSNAMSLEFCTQGHPPGYFLRNHHLEELWTAGIAMGAQAFDVVATKKQSLQIGDLLFLYTDGVIEACDSEGAIFGARRLKELLIQSRLQSSRSIVQNVMKEIGEFSSNTLQHDDKTLLAIRVFS